jgi:hypothetical protein
VTSGSNRTRWSEATSHPPGFKQTRMIPLRPRPPNQPSICPPIWTASSKWNGTWAFLPGEHSCILRKALPETRRCLLEARGSNFRPWSDKYVRFKTYRKTWCYLAHRRRKAMSLNGMSFSGSSPSVRISHSVIPYEKTSDAGLY